MWNFMGRSTVASAIVDFTSDLWLLPVGLIGLMALSAGMIVFAAIRHHKAQKPQPVASTPVASTDQQEAA